jgi:hypothetical protein
VSDLAADEDEQEVNPGKGDKQRDQRILDQQAAVPLAL